MAEAISARDVARNELIREFDLAERLAARLEARAQVSAAGISVIVAGASVAVAADETLGERIRDGTPVVFAGIAVVAFFGALMLSLFLAWPRPIAFTPASAVRSAVSSVKAYDELPKMNADVAAWLRVLDRNFITQYESLLNGLQLRGRLLLASYFSLAIGTVSTAVLAAVVTLD